MKILTSIIAVALCFSGCFIPMLGECSNEVIREVKSPDGRYVATLYERDCGATTSGSTHINLRESSADFNAEDESIFVVKWQPKVNIIWNDPSSLRIECLDCRSEEIFKQEPVWNNISISYLTGPPNTAQQKFDWSLF